MHSRMCSDDILLKIKTKKRIKHSKMSEYGLNDVDVSGCLNDVEIS